MPQRGICPPSNTGLRAIQEYELRERSTQMLPCWITANDAQVCNNLDSYFDNLTLDLIVHLVCSVACRNYPYR